MFHEVFYLLNATISSLFIYMLINVAAIFAFTRSYSLQTSSPHHIVSTSSLTSPIMTQQSSTAPTLPSSMIFTHFLSQWLQTSILILNLLSWR